MTDFALTTEISKVEPEKRQFFGWASITKIDGKPVVDLQGDVIEIEELEKAAYDYVLHSRTGGEMHQRIGKSAPKKVATLIESFVVTPEKVEKLGLQEGSVPIGWWTGYKVHDDDAWEGIKKGKYTALSIHGVGKRVPVSDIDFAKHLIGRHRQEDHDPKKGKESNRHSRKDHQKASGLSEKDYKRRRNIGLLTGGLTGAAAATGQGVFRQNRPLGEAYAGHFARSFGFAPPGPMATTLPIGGLATRNISFTPAQEAARRKRELSKREKELIYKYLTGK